MDSSTTKDTHSSTNHILNRRTLVVGSSLALFAIAVLVTIVLRSGDSVIPKAVLSQAGYAIIAPGKTERLKVDPATVKYDEANKQLSYNTTAPGQPLIVSQQPTPVSFSDAPDVYQKLLDRMNQYETFEAPLGKVYLTKPANLGDPNVQVAVVNTQGTLIFLRSNNQLSTDQWRQLILDFEIAKR